MTFFAFFAIGVFYLFTKLETRENNNNLNKADNFIIEDKQIKNNENSKVVTAPSDKFKSEKNDELSNSLKINKSDSALTEDELKNLMGDKYGEKLFRG